MSKKFEEFMRSLPECRALPPGEVGRYSPRNHTICLSKERRGSLWHELGHACINLIRNVKMHIQILILMKHYLGYITMTSPKGKIDAIFSEWDKPDSPGCALAIARAGEMIYERGYGIANLEYDIPITPETKFHVASVSKQFTAMAVTLLVQEDKLSLDADIHEYLPEIPDFGVQITPRHLLHHTSGLRDQWNLLRIAGWRMEDVITTETSLNSYRHKKNSTSNQEQNISTATQDTPSSP